MLVIGTHRWPLDSDGNVRLLLPRNAARVPTLPAAMLLLPLPVPAGDGAGPDATLTSLRSKVDGRRVFVGSSAFLGDVVITPQGELTGTAVVANAYDALRRDAVLKPPSPVGQAALLALALVPSIVTGSRRRPALRADALAAALALALVALATGAALPWLKIQFSPLLPAVVIGVGIAAALLLTLRANAVAQRELRAQRAAAEAANVAKSDFLAEREPRTAHTAARGAGHGRRARRHRRSPPSSGATSTIFRPPAATSSR